MKPQSDTGGHPADLLQGQRPDVVERYYDEGGSLAYHTERGKQVCRWENPNGGVIINYSGMTQIWMRLADPGVYYAANGQQVSERDAQRAGFNTAYWRGQRRALDIQRKAAEHADKIRAQSAEHLKSPEDKRAERAAALRAEAAKAVARVEREAHAAADRQRTDATLFADRIPDAETPPAT
jgi:hypothetical protein